MKKFYKIMFMSLFILFCVFSFPACSCTDKTDLYMDKINTAFEKFNTEELNALDISIQVQVNAEQGNNIYSSLFNMNLKLINKENEQIGYYNINATGIQSVTSYYVNGYSHTKTGNQTAVIQAEELIEIEDTEVDVNNVNIVEINKLKPNVTFDGKKSGFEKYTIEVRDIDLNKIITDVVGLNLGTGNFVFQIWINAQTGDLYRYNYSAELIVEGVYVNIILDLKINAINDNVLFNVPEDILFEINYYKLPIYTITYNLDGGTNQYNNPLTYKSMSDTINLQDPTKIGYVFKGWYTDAEFTNEITQISKGSEGNISLFAKWENVFSGGDGTINNPYKISTKTHLETFANLVNSNNTFRYKYYILENDIDLSGDEWIPIGGSSLYDFSGHFNGQGYEISNFKITSQNYYQCGLFGNISNASISNLGVTNFVIDYSKASNLYVGGLVGVSDNSSIINCYSKNGSLIVKSTNGASYGTFSYSSIGGLVGTMSNTTIANCYSECYINFSATGILYAGGLVGYIPEGSKISNCYATGNMDAVLTLLISDYVVRDLYAGGLVGCVFNSSIINNCYATGSITLNSNRAYAGGLIGRAVNSSVTVTNCYATGNLSAEGNSQFSSVNVGQLVAEIYIATITNCYYYEGQTYYRKNATGEYITSNVTVSGLTSCSIIQLNSEDFYTSMLGWDADVWDFSDLDFANGKHPN